MSDSIAINVQISIYTAATCALKVPRDLAEQYLAGEIAADELACGAVITNVLHLGGACVDDAREAWGADPGALNLDEYKSQLREALA